MMKKTLLYITLILVAMALGSCTRNHGDIGIWFGTWLVESITADGAPVNVEGDYFFQFQNKVFRVSQVSDHEQLVASFGTWEESEDGNKMTIYFPDPSVYYIVMPGLEANNEFTVTHTSSKDITFTKTDAVGTTFAYHLKKQP
jgi:hypothetical protein